jgi:hypothetical protein
MTTEEALKLKPEFIGIVPYELEFSSPRPMVWYNKDGNKIQYGTYLLINGTAAQAWIVAYHLEEDSEGPDFNIEYCYESSNGLHFGKIHRSYDLYHFVADGGWAYDNWLRKTLREDSYLTVIYNKQKPDEHIQYIPFEYRIGKPYDPFAKKSQKEIRKFKNRRIVLGILLIIMLVLFAPLIIAALILLLAFVMVIQMPYEYVTDKIRAYSYRH